MNKRILFILCASLFLVSCNNKNDDNKEEKIVNKYTVTWKNYDGTILEIDENVLENSDPTYNSSLPSRETNGSISYVFSSWSPTISKVTSNITYTANFIERDANAIPGINPVISDDLKTVIYGFYPQTHVSDDTIISALNSLSPASNGYYLYNNDYYAKVTAKLYNSESYTFSTNVNIVNGNTYYFKVEPISWKVLSINNNEILLLTEKLLDACCFNEDYTSNTFSSSTINTFINTTFYYQAFFENDEDIKGNKGERVSLLSSSDYLNASYGFDTTDSLSTSRTAKVTDYALARGAWVNKRDNAYKGNSSYWSKSPSTEYSYAAIAINSAGVLAEYSVERDNHCVRPVVIIKG